MKKIINQVFPSERALYGEDSITLENCSFDGEEDGESALKEAKNVSLNKCFMNLRYPLWHDDNVSINGCEMTDKCRAALWYSSNISIVDSILGGIKALRECRKVTMTDTKVVSPEFGWRSEEIISINCEITGEYPFFMAKRARFDRLKLEGKYSFQYTEDLTVDDSFLKTKDAFWHSKNVTIKNSTIDGEYLGWYSDGLVLVNCRIIGTQPLCYCKNLLLVDCEMENADLSFEYSDVSATINGSVISVKNPKSGRIVADDFEEIILTDDSKYKCECLIEKRTK